MTSQRHSFAGSSLGTGYEDLQRHSDEGSTERISSTFMRSTSSSSRNDDDGGAGTDIVWGNTTNTQTILGRVRKFGNLNRLELFLFLVTFVAVLTGVFFSTVIFIEGTPKDVVFSLLIIVDSLFILFYLTHGVFTEAFFELAAMCFTLLLICVLFVVNNFLPDQDNAALAKTDFNVMLTFIGLSLICVIVATKLAWKYWTSGNLIFRIVGGDMKYQRMCRYLLLAQSLLAFDAQWTINNLVLVFQDGVTRTSNEQEFLLGSGLLLVGVWLIIGYIAMRFESMYLVWVFVGSSLFQPLYIMYLFATTIISGPVQWTLLNTSMYIAGTVCLLTHFSLLAVFATVAFNFEKGLAEKVYPQKPSPTVSQSATTSTIPADELDPFADVEGSPLISSPGPTATRPGRSHYGSVSEDPDAIYPAP